MKALDLLLCQCPWCRVRRVFVGWLVRGIGPSLGWCGFVVWALANDRHVPLLINAGVSFGIAYFAPRWAREWRDRRLAKLAHELRGGWFPG